jgi:lysophospholipase L1-like esterase
LSGLRSSDFRFIGFYARRARRILPALAVVLAGVLVIGWSQFLPATYQSLGLHAFASALFFPNLLSWSEVGYFDAAAETKPLLHLWSLGVGEQFYVVWPILLVLLSKRRRWLTACLAAIVAASFVYSCYATLHQPAAAFYSPLSRLWELGTGGILASANIRVKNRNSISIFGLALIIGSAIVLEKTSPFPGARALIPVTGATLVIVFGSNFLGRKWPVSVGLISYPLYLWHWPLLSFAAIAGLTSLPVLATMGYDPASGGRVLKCWLDRASAFEKYSPECSAGATLIWGDSHAARLYAGLKQDGVDLAQFTRDGCPPFIGAGDETCAQSNAAIMQLIAQLKPRQVILFAVWENYGLNDASNGGPAMTLKELKNIVDDVVVIGPTPYWTPDLPTQVYDFWRSNGRLPDRLQPRPMPYRTIDDALAALSATAHVRFISVFDALCDEEGCLTHTPKSKGELLTWDYGHLTVAGARFVATLLKLN